MLSNATEIKIVDLFSGAGGLSLGWLSVDTPTRMRLVAAIDSDPTLDELFTWNFPDTRFVLHRFADALEKDESRHVSALAALEEGDVDVLLAGPPCQVFSAAGKRSPHSDSRLAFHVCDLVQVLRPKLVLLENVPEFGRVQDGRLLGRVRVRLSQSGYTTEVRLLHAVEFGVPQTRARCFTLAVRNDLARPASAFRDLLSASHYSARTKSGNDQPLWNHLPNSCLPAVTTADAIDDLPHLAAGEGEQIIRLTSCPSSVYQMTARDRECRLYNHVAVNHSAEMIDAMSRLKPGETPQHAMGHPMRRKEYFRAAYARLDPQQPAPTITTQTHNPGSGRFTHYRDHRVITVREAARLQSFPDSFRFFGPQEVQRRHVGNAVPPLLSRAIASALLPLVTEQVPERSF